MKRFFGTLLLCGFLAASTVQAAKSPVHPKTQQSKAAKKQAAKVRKANAKAQKAAKRKAQARKAV